MLQSRADLARIMHETEPSFPSDNFILQPFIPGRPLSMAVIGNRDGTDRILLPVADQLLSDDGRFSYLGGRIPAGIPHEEKVFDLVMTAADVAGPVIGYCGFDLVLPEDGSDPLLVEINPRLTTSYIGYRSCCRDNLAERILGLPNASSAIRWHDAVIDFQPDGESVVAEGRRL